MDEYTYIKWDPNRLLWSNCESTSSPCSRDLHKEQQKEEDLVSKLLSEIKGLNDYITAYKACYDMLADICEDFKKSCDKYEKEAAKYKQEVEKLRNIANSTLAESLSKEVAYIKKISDLEDKIAKLEKIETATWRYPNTKLPMLPYIVYNLDYVPEYGVYSSCTYTDEK